MIPAEGAALETTFMFDVNETLLDSSSLDPLFESAFGTGKALRRKFFSHVLARAWACTLSGKYRAFSEIAGVALDAVTREEGKTAIGEREQILHRFAHMPAHADAAPALAHLQKQGAKSYALTNSAQAAAEEALENAGLRSLLTDVLSVETVRAFKPDPRVYQMAVRAAHDVPSKTWLVAAHWWDCMGAARQGWKTALVVRDATALEPAMINPTVAVSSLIQAVDTIAPADSPVS